MATPYILLLWYWLRLTEDCLNFSDSKHFVLLATETGKILYYSFRVAIASADSRSNPDACKILDFSIYDNFGLGSLWIKWSSSLP